MANEIYIQGKRDLNTGQKRPKYRAKETYIQSKRDLHTVSNETYSYGKGDLLIWQKSSLLAEQKGSGRPYGKRGLFLRQKRPIDMAKEI